MTVHLLDAGATRPVAADGGEIALVLFTEGQFVKYVLTPATGGDDPAGPSVFSIVDQELCDALLHEEGLRGRLQVTINGKQYSAAVEHEPHDHEGHGGHDHP